MKQVVQHWNRQSCMILYDAKESEYSARQCLLGGTEASGTDRSVYVRCMQPRICGICLFASYDDFCSSACLFFSSFFSLLFLRVLLTLSLS